MNKSRHHLFVTGAAGFVGSEVLEYFLTYTNWNITCPVTMRHHGNQYRLTRVLDKHGTERVDVVNCDLAMPFTRSLFQRSISKWGNVSVIFNIASESHVERSLSDPVPFVRNNVDLMLNMLEFARNEPDLQMFFHMSTDEVFGPAGTDGGHHEWASIKPSNPYSASKASQEAIAYSYWRAYNLPILITNTMNLIGRTQHPEKFIPKTIKAIYEDKPVEVHVTPNGMPGSRCWIDVRDFASAWLHLAGYVIKGERTLTYYPDMSDELHKFNVVGEHATNLDIAKRIAGIMERSPDIRKVNYHQSRPGHDPHYALDDSKMKDIGWQPGIPLDLSLKNIVQWYMANPEGRLYE
jgi:dTDP-glucose 4,6-dehydratase